MFIRSSTAINDCLIALDAILGIGKDKNCLSIVVTFKTVGKEVFAFIYESEEALDKAFEELCAFLNSNYKLRDFT
jgi:hypothetical protein